jgi:ribonuclease BN (tRNA processing enzyme)
VIKGDFDAEVQLGERAISVAELAADILVKNPGLKLAYATDFADITENHARLCWLAHNAHTLFCEASFVNADSDRATETGHLTTRACGNIGTEAAVEHLVPFHFSRRYQGNASRSYQEVSRACSHTVVPDR